MVLVPHNGGSSVAEGNGRTKSATGPTRKVPGAAKIATELLPGFSRKLSAMLAAGMPIVGSLAALERQTRNPNFKLVIEAVRKNIENGMSLSESLSRFPSVFDELYSNMIRGGETSGQLAETIGRLADLLQSSVRIRRKIKSALTYPVAVLCIAFAITIALIVFVVPVFADIFSQLKGNLPAPTRALMAMSELGRKHGLAAIVAAVAGVILFRKWKATPGGARVFDRFLLKAPVFGGLSQNIVAARFSRTLAQLVRSGVPILTSLDIAGGAAGNKVAAEVIARCRVKVEEGEPLSASLGYRSVFPDMLIEMLQAGEKTGKVDQMLDCVADFYDEEVSVTLDSLTSLLEPILMVLLGVIIGGIVVSMFLPIFKLPTMVS